jgi:hypothetical protein
MANRVDERGYEQKGNSRQREPHLGKDYEEEPRMSGKNMRRQERDLERGRVNEGDLAEERRYSERQAEIPRDQPLSLRMTSSLSDAFVTAFERGAAVLGENMRMYQDETVRFMTERLEHDAATLEQLGKSRSVLDLFAIQQQWLNDTTRAYNEEWMRLGKLTGDATQRGAADARSAQSETRRSAYDAE